MLSIIKNREDFRETGVCFYNRCRQILFFCGVLAILLSLQYFLYFDEILFSEGDPVSGLFFGTGCFILRFSIFKEKR
jgi:tellurite resistance protein TehA-like permease